MKKFVILLLTLLIVGCSEDFANDTPNKIENNMNTNGVSSEKRNIKENYIVEVGNSTILFPSEDGLDITADLYLIDESSPMFILFHQAGSSRGEYLETAERLNKKGYNVMAVDQRSGLTVNGVMNETARRAAELGVDRNHVDAARDVRSTIQYAVDHFQMDFYLLGSSYSASLILVIAEDYHDYVNALFAFSPGEYFLYEGSSISVGSKDLSIPTFVTSASHETNEWEDIFDSIGSDNKVAFYPEGFGKHGSKSLWESTSSNIEFWDAMDFFIDSLEKDAN